MITKVDTAYEMSNVDVGEDYAEEFGRRLIQHEQKIREEIVNFARENTDEKRKGYYDSMLLWTGELAKEDLTEEQRRTMAHQAFSTFEDAEGVEVVTAYDAVKLALLTGEREGFRLAVGLMLKLLTKQTTGADLMTVVPDEATLLGVLRAMTDDNYADRLILTLFGYQGDTDGPGAAESSGEVAGK